MTERDEFVNRKALEYLHRHPDARPSFARRMGRQYWYQFKKKREKRNA